MTDGFYRITDDKGYKKIQYVFQNQTDIGSVSYLLARGSTFEEVCVLTPGELEEKIREVLWKSNPVLR